MQVWYWISGETGTGVSQIDKVDTKRKVYRDLQYTVEQGKRKKKERRRSVDILVFPPFLSEAVRFGVAHCDYDHSKPLPNSFSLTINRKIPLFLINQDDFLTPQNK